MENRAMISRPLLIVMSLAVLVLAIGYKLAKSPSPSGPTAQPTDQSVESAPAPQPATDDSELHALSPEQVSKAAQLPAVVQATSRSARSSTPAPARIEPTPYSRQLMGALTNIDFSRGPITTAQAEQWKQSLQTLTRQGAAALPAIREFLDLNQDLNFAAVSGGELLGQPSLRTALINALQQIGGPEATSQMVQLLQSTTVPSEIALLAQHLEQLAPGQYRQEAITAANEVLAMAGKGELPGWDVGALFKMFQNYGDPAAASAMEQFQSQWKYYAAMSLAALPSGQGVPALLHQAQDPGSSHDFAFEMLAQTAVQNPEATTALLDQARLNHIPDSSWNKIAAALAGEQYLVGAPPPETPLSGLKQFHIEAGNQNFYSLPASANTQGAQGIALIDQLLGLTSNPTAITALQGARASLAAATPK